MFASGWDQMPLLPRATAVGIPFHRGEFGWWNQALLLVFGLVIVFSIVSGWVMYFKRYAKGARGMPVLLPGAWKSASPYALVGTLVMFVCMPLLALSGALVGVVELVRWWLQRKAAA